MELPKNITQIGESDCHCKIYAEDYVVSYMKQLNQLAQNKDMAVALYGIRREEGDVSYSFLYGAAKLTFLQQETRHLSQAQLQEIEKLRKRYFRDYEFQGYRLLNGEMIEGFHICEQGICRYVQGYAQFYEKNESMLAYMLDTREDAQPETVDRQKYEEVRLKQEERRTDFYQKGNAKEHPSKSYRKMKMAVVACFALLCMVGLSSLNGKGGLENLRETAGRLVEGTMEQRLPDEDSVPANADTIVAEDKLTEAIQKENADAANAETAASGSEESGSVESESAASEVTNPGTADTDAGAIDESNQVTSDTTIADTQTTVAENSVTPADNAASQSYVIQKGDTLTDISIRQYGSKSKVSAICSLNGIDDPDDIKIGQKILLP